MATPVRTARQMFQPIQEVAHLPPTGRWAILLPGPTDQGCIVTDPDLGGGHQSSASIVRTPATGPNTRFIVRKMRKSRYQTMRLDRADREVRICTEIERRVAADPFVDRPHIVSFIQALDVPGNVDKTFWRRTTFWAWCNMGSALHLRDAYTAQGGGAVAPYYMLARFLREGLSAINWLMHPGLYGMATQRAIFHNDLHAGNILVHWKTRSDGPHFYLGDFGFARFAGEARPVTAEELSHMSPLARRMYSTPRDTVDSPAPDDDLDADGNPAREEWDVHQFLLAFTTTPDSLLQPYNMFHQQPGVTQVPALSSELLAVLRDLEAMNDRDTANALGPRSEFPGYQDLRPVLARLAAYERVEKAAHDDAGAATTTATAAGTAPFTSGTAHNPRHVADYAAQRAMWETHRVRRRVQQTARRYADFQMDAEAAVNGSGIAFPYATVNVDDARSLRTTQRQLAAFVRKPEPQVPGAPMTPVRRWVDLAQIGAAALCGDEGLPQGWAMRPDVAMGGTGAAGMTFMTGSPVGSPGSLPVAWAPSASPTPVRPMNELPGTGPGQTSPWSSPWSSP